LFQPGFQARTALLLKQVSGQMFLQKTDTIVFGLQVNWIGIWKKASWFRKHISNMKKINGSMNKFWGRKGETLR